VYCDPPFQSNSCYYDDCGVMRPKFNHTKFWDWCRKMSKHNLVFVSEYSAPSDFIKVWSKSTQTCGPKMIESLFLIN
jgi:DNA adenine methylase